MQQKAAGCCFYQVAVRRSLSHGETSKQRGENCGNIKNVNEMRRAAACHKTKHFSVRDAQGGAAAHCVGQVWGTQHPQFHEELPSAVMAKDNLFFHHICAFSACKVSVCHSSWQKKSFFHHR